MALAIDTKHLLDQFIPNEKRSLGAEFGSGGRFQLHRVYVYAVVSIHEHGSEPEDWGVERAALDWQADQDDDLEELEVYHNLKHLAVTRPSVRRILSSSNGTNAATTTLVANVQSPTFSARLQDRPASSFQRFSRRTCIVDFRRAPSGNLPYGFWDPSRFPYEIVPNVSIRPVARWPWGLYLNECPDIVWTNTTQEYTVYWQVQFDYVDLHTPCLMSTQRRGKRRRTVHPCHQVSSRRQEDTSRAHHPPDAKRFKGVRFRPDRKRWVAEMKPPRSKNKVSFGDFPSQADAARVVDVAFHYYGKPLNFADTPQILSARPPLPELGPEDKFNFVREQAKWLASIASTFPSSSSSPFARGTSGIRSPVPSLDIPESSRGACSAPLGFRSFSEISSSLGCGGEDEADDGVSQPPPSWVHPNPMASIFEIELETMEADFTAADHTADFGEGQSTLQGSAENTTANPCDIAISADFATGIFPDLVNFPGMEESIDIPSMLMELLLNAPPASAYQASSPSDFQCDVAHRLLEEQENFGYEELLF
jgi:hypothetical protein